MALLYTVVSPFEGEGGGASHAGGGGAGHSGGSGGDSAIAGRGTTSPLLHKGWVCIGPNKFKSNISIHTLRHACP